MPTTLLSSVQSFSYGSVTVTVAPPPSPPSPPADASYRVAKIHRVRYNLGHFLQMSLQLLVKLAAENDLYHNESYESSLPCNSVLSAAHPTWYTSIHTCNLYPPPLTVTRSGSWIDMWGPEKLATLRYLAHTAPSP
jgi:hypothetical protein